MKRLTLVGLQLDNFKGIDHLRVSVGEYGLEVLGDNATGKTTVFDAFTWLLFGKDSNNRTDFQIKGLDESGKVKQHGLEHSVEGVFSLDGETFTLKRVYREVWTKKRGMAESVFGGHKTDYFIDDVPKNKKDFTEKVESMISEDVFKLITNPLYFNEQLDWKKRRAILLELIGDITDEEMVKDNSDLQEFVSRLNGRDIEDYKKMILAKQKKLNQELDRIPIRIDEIRLNRPKIEENVEELQTKYEALKADIALKERRITAIENGGDIAEKRKELSEVELAISQLKNEQESNSIQDIYSMKARIQEHQGNMELLQYDVENAKKIQEMNFRSIAKLDEEVKAYRLKWLEVNGKEFNHETECTCPTCHQELPKEQVEKAREEAEKTFNVEKANELEEIQSQAVLKKKEMESIQEANQKLDRKIMEAEKEIELKKQKLEKDKERLQELESRPTSLEKNEAYTELKHKKVAILEEMKAIEESSQGMISMFREKINEMEKERESLQERIELVKIAKRSEARIEELYEMEKSLTGEYEKLEKEMYLSEEFTRAKVTILEQRINEKFQLARFKLFEEQVNGGLKETCETMYEGVPFHGGLNNAMKINIGLDIISTLSEFYGMKAPIFIDNAESVTRFMDIDSQVIRLVVDEKYKQLEINPMDKAVQSA